MTFETPELLKKNLSSIISDMENHSELFVKQPGIDFSRNRKLSFSQTMEFILSMNGNSIRKEWLDFWHYSLNAASTSAFFQQRLKILPETMDFLFHSFLETFTGYDKYRGYRLIACDGSDLAITYNPKDPDTYRRHNSMEKNEKGYNQLHLNALYDLQNRIYLDAIVQPGRYPNEAQALLNMMQRSRLDGNTILIADRGYESYNILAHVQEKGFKYLIRMKDIGSKGILTHLPLPDQEEFDCELSLTLTKKQTKEIKSQPEKYRCLTNKSVCDFLDPVNRPFYTLNFRVLRFPITNETSECIITNLSMDEFPPEEIKKLYGARWGIERSFRELKYTIGLTNFHAKKVEYILQEIFSRLIIYNFCERITTGIVIQKKKTKYI